MKWKKKPFTINPLISQKNKFNLIKTPPGRSHRSDMINDTKKTH